MITFKEQSILNAFNVLFIVETRSRRFQSNG
jgi:hypothetical protein